MLGKLVLVIVVVAVVFWLVTRFRDSGRGDR
jgi:flagellar biogenesis protein FliO